MGFKFTMTLNRKITGEESAQLTSAASGTVEVGSDSLPTNADIPVTRLDFDDTESPSLLVAVESALAAVRGVPELTVPGLTVQPVTRPAADPVALPVAEPVAQHAA